EGVQMGTRFIASVECHAHPIFKNAIVQAGETGTVVTGRKTGAAHRGGKNAHTLKLLELDFSGASVDEVREEMARDPSTVRGQLVGDADYGRMSFGTSCALVHEIL